MPGLVSAVALVAGAVSVVAGVAAAVCPLFCVVSGLVSDTSFLTTETAARLGIRVELSATRVFAYMQSGLRKCRAYLRLPGDVTDS